MEGPGQRKVRPTGGGRGARGRGSGRGSSGGRGGGRGHARRERGGGPLADLLSYLRSCTRTLTGDGLATREQEVLLATRAVEEMGDRALLVAADQRGSKPLERLLRHADAEAFAALFQRLMETFPELAPNQYASHVLQSALASWAERQSPAAGVEAGVTAPTPAAATPLVALCAALQEDCGWPALVHDACASHAARALLLALGGYAPQQQGRDRAAARAGLLPALRHDVPPAVADARRGAARALATLLREDDGVCLSAHASPVVQLLLRVLRDRGDRALVAEVAAAVVGSSSSVAGAPPSVERCDVLLRSAPGSRALEAVVETGGAEAFGALFAGYFRTRLHALVSGEGGDFGVFLAQRVADGLRDEPQLKIALAEVDFTSCVGPEATPPQQAIAVKFVEACLRLRTCLKQCATEIFRALGLRASSEYYRAWPTLLSLAHMESPLELLRPDKRCKDCDTSGVAASSGVVERQNTESIATLPPAIRQLPSAGPQLLGCLLRFPADAVQPLNSGLRQLLEHREVLNALAREAKTARVLEAALTPSSALLPKLRARLVHAFKGLLGQLGPHHVGGWVCAALWRASLGNAVLREAFAKELLEVEGALRAHNFAVWKICGLDQAKVRQEEWAEQQHKADKVQRLFGELLEGGDAEGAIAAKRSRERAAEDAADREAKVLADPFVSGLLPAGRQGSDEDSCVASSAEDQRCGAAAGKGTGPSGNTRGDDDEIDTLFTGDRKQRKRRRPLNPVGEVHGNPAAFALASRGSCGASAAGGATGAGGATEHCKEDAALSEALELIAGRAPARVRNRRKKRAAAAASAAAAALEEAQVAAPSMPPRKKRRRGGGGSAAAATSAQS